MTFGSTTTQNSKSLSHEVAGSAAQVRPLLMSPDDSLSNDELLTTTRVVRRRLDLTRVVPRALVEECLSLAVQAPTASNRQEWHWVFVDNPTTRGHLAEIYRSAPAVEDPLPLGSWIGRDAVHKRQDAVRASHEFLVAHLHEVPLMLIPCHLGRVDNAPVAKQAALWGSLYPAVWNLFLALRTRQLGAAWTTTHLHNERAVAELLGIPFDQYTQGGLFPIAYTTGSGFRPAERRHLGDIVHWNHW
jgi:nitroreductase